MLASTWLFSTPAAILVTLAALSVPVVAWRVGGDDAVVSEAVAPLLADARRPVTPSRGTGGSGFGLALCAAIVRAHSGSIGVESVATGVAFTVRLPAGGG